MNRIILIATAFLLQSCSDAVVEVVEKPPMVVQLSTAKLTQVSAGYEFPATVTAVKSVDLKFEVSGRLIFENLTEGSEVKKGQVLARIDPAPFERRVAESQIRLEDAVRNLQRIEEIFKKNVVSQRDLDDAKSQFSIAEIALATAKQDLSYSTIIAPFDAVVGARYIENNSYIVAGDTLANLQDRSELYFTFEVPERIMTANSGNRNVKATARIIGQEDNVFDIHYVEHKTTPDPVTQTYGVTFAIDGKVTNLFYPGSRATVNILSQEQEKEALLIPINSLVGDKDAGFSVWLYQASSQSVELVNVEVSALQGQFAIISSGIKSGDQVVSAAVNQMREGLKVRAYKAGK